MDTNLIANYEDINDEGQTVTIPIDLLDNKVPDTPYNWSGITQTGFRPKTGDPGVMGYIILLAAAAGGIVMIFIPHTTAAVTINENADPDVVRDFTTEMNKVADLLCTVEVISDKDELTKSEKEFFHSKRGFNKNILKQLVKKRL